MRRIRNKNIVICPRNKQFTDLVVCAASCNKKCKIYFDKIDLKILEFFILNHPEYVIIGEIMPKEKNTQKIKEKIFWILDENKKVIEVKESEIINNPQKYLNKEIWDKPPNRYKIVIALKKVK